jgi:hypothetical protein
MGLRIAAQRPNTRVRRTFRRMFPGRVEETFSPRMGGDPRHGSGTLILVGRGFGLFFFVFFWSRPSLARDPPPNPKPAA